MEILSTRDTWWMTQCEAVLLAEGISVRWLSPWERGAGGALTLDVPASQAERAMELLSEQLGDELVRRAKEVPPRAWVPLFLQPDFAFALSAALLLVAFYLAVGGTERSSELFEAGVMSTRAFAAGEWWRIVTAATLHADAEHAVGNAGFLLLLGWASSERFGAGVTLAMFIATAVGGFAASLLFSDAAYTVGASGGLFGLLGASGGHGVRTRRDRDFPWRERVRVGGAAVLLLAFTAFSRESNVEAHVGGFVTGVLLGVLAPARPGGGWLQLAAGLAAVAVVVGAWAQA